MARKSSEKSKSKPDRAAKLGKAPGVTLTENQLGQAAGGTESVSFNYSKIEYRY